MERCRNSRNKLQRKTLSDRFDDKSVEDILIRLPVKSLVRFKCVSKRWKSFIEEDASFIQSHLSRSKRHPQLLITTSFGDDTLLVYSPEKNGFEGGAALLKVSIPWCGEAAMLKPIDGLCCFVGGSDGDCIYNLGTREVTPWAQSSIPIQGAFFTQRQTCGFGFDPSSNKYKVVRVFEISKSMMSRKVEHKCEVLTVGENRWRRIDEVPPTKLNGPAGVYAKGSIYWRNAGVSLLNPPDNEAIVAFDFETEKFRVIQIPDSIVGPPEILRKCGKRAEKFTVTALDGRMALIDRVDQYIVKLWISDDDSYKEKKMTTNWTEETMELPSSFQSDHRLYVNPVQGTDEIVIKAHIPEDERSPRGFVSIYIYSRINKSFRKIDITGISPLLTYPYTYGVHIYHESLLPVQNAGKKQDQPTPSLV